jgi:hypothetical protein
MGLAVSVVRVDRFSFTPKVDPQNTRNHEGDQFNAKTPGPRQLIS